MAKRKSLDGRVRVSKIPASQKRGGYSGSASKVKPKPPKGPAATVPVKK